MSIEPNLLQEDLELVARIRREELLRQYVREQMKPTHESRLRLLLGSATSFLFDKETLRTILTAALIPFTVWYVSAQDRQLADDRSDIDEVTKLVPYLARTDQSANIAFATLKALQESRPNSDIINAALIAAKYSPNAGVQYESAVTIAALNSSQSSLPNPQSVALAPGVIAVQNPAVVKPALVYMQIYDEKDKDTAVELQTALQIQGIPVPPIENVGQKKDMKKFAQVKDVDIRYYYASDQPAAQYTANVLKRALQNLTASSLPEGTSVHIRNLTAYSLQKPVQGALEVWLPCSVSDGCPPQ